MRTRRLLIALVAALAVGAAAGSYKGGSYGGASYIQSVRASGSPDTGAVMLPPVADFAGSPTAGSDPLTVLFEDRSTHYPTTWAWNFGDGGTSLDRHPWHQYTEPGTYSVTLAVQNVWGQDALTRSNYITVTAAGIPPVAAFSGTPLSGDAPLTVAFTDASTGSPTS
ncbi:MAG: PKD domain-containing protein, partial [Gammaproteobacteria bacterium]|nr:PKD domain-containing protein [Gammaproteobacteria bacterium]